MRPLPTRRTTHSCLEQRVRAKRPVHAGRFVCAVLSAPDTPNVHRDEGNHEQNERCTHAYIRDGLGITDEELDRLREELLE